MRRFERETYEAISRAARISVEQLSAYLTKIEANPLDRVSRFAVLGAHVAPAHVQGEQLMWFIENEPSLSLGMYAERLDNGSGQLERAAELWRRAVARRPDDLGVLENAVWFLVATGQKDAVELLEQRLTRLPTDADAWELAAIVFAFMAGVNSKQATQWRRRCVESAFRSFAEDADPTQRLPVLHAVREPMSKLEKLDVFQLLDRATARLADGKKERALRCLRDALEVSPPSEPMARLAELLTERGSPDGH